MKQERERGRGRQEKAWKRDEGLKVVLMRLLLFHEDEEEEEKRSVFAIGAYDP